MAATENTPLLSNGVQESKSFATKAKSWFGPANRILLAAFLMSFTLGITQVPIIYVFRIMECDVFYSHNPPFDGPGDRCSRREINAGTATQVSLVGMSTSFFGVINLFVCGYFIKLWGPRWSFVSQSLLLGVRVSTQILAVTIGGRAGIIIFQATQVIGVIGGPRGYQLVVNTAVSELVPQKERTIVFGRLQGSVMLGIAFGFLLGGVLGDVYGIRRPFEFAFFLYIITSTYGAFFMPTISREAIKERMKDSKGVTDFFAPLKVIIPHKYRLESGKTTKNYGLIMLAIGIFLGAFATGYAPIMLQMYATSEFNFGTTENGALMFGNALIRGLFLLIGFPKIITAGRLWYNGSPSPAAEPVPSNGQDIPTDPEQFDTAAGQDGAQQPIKAPETDEEDSGTEFDLMFVRWSLVVDSIVTAAAGFSTQGWQVYMAAFLLPFASGSAPAAKGVMTQMCPPHQRPDAIGAITLVESAAMLTTQGIFGLIYAGLSDIGRPSLTFFCNAGFALVGVTTLFLTRFPPPNSKRIDGEDENTDNRESEETS